MSNADGRGLIAVTATTASTAQWHEGDRTGARVPV